MVLVKIKLFTKQKFVELFVTLNVYSMPFNIKRDKGESLIHKGSSWICNVTGRQLLCVTLLNNMQRRANSLRQLSSFHYFEAASTTISDSNDSIGMMVETIWTSLFITDGRR